MTRDRVPPLRKCPKCGAKFVSANQAAQLDATMQSLDAMTWRGIGLNGAVMPVLILLGFAAAFWTIAATRFRWEEG
jgi:hypothetical protein